MRYFARRPDGGPVSFSGLDEMQRLLNKGLITKEWIAHQEGGVEWKTVGVWLGIEKDDPQRALQMNDDIQQPQSCAPPPMLPPSASEPQATVQRPVFLGILTVLGMVGAVGGALMSLAALANGSPLGILLLLLFGFLFAVVLSLRNGQYWAWVAIQFIWAVNILLSLLRAATVHPIALITSVPSILLFFYIYTDGVRKFCIVGKHA